MNSSRFWGLHYLNGSVELWWLIANMAVVAYSKEDVRRELLFYSGYSSVVFLELVIPIADTAGAVSICGAAI